MWDWCAWVHNDIIKVLSIGGRLTDLAASLQNIKSKYKPIVEMF